MKFITLNGRSTDTPETFLSGRPLLASIVGNVVAMGVAAACGSSPWVALGCCLAGVLAMTFAQRST